MEMEIVASAGLHDTIPKLIASCSPHAAWHGMAWMLT